MTPSREVIFIDQSVVGWQSIVAGVGDGVRIVMLDSTQDGLIQIAAALATERDLGAIHIVSHGSAGQITLGGAGIDAGALAQYEDTLAAIGRSLSASGDILLYGCDVGQGATGEHFLQQLAAYTGSDVAASADLTGAAALGGNWTLEAQVGSVTTQALDGSAFAGTLAMVSGTAYNDYLEGSDGADTLSGGAGDDTLAGSAGDDLMDGGADGYFGDTVDYSVGPAGVSVNLATGKATDNWGNTDTLVGIEHINGSAFADTLIGNAGNNWFRPGDGNDVVIGNGGNDTVMYENTPNGVTVDLMNGMASGADIGVDTLSGIRNVHTGGGADVIQLSDLGGYVFARAGDDRITGGAGNDILYGGSGNDTIDGGGGRDYINFQVDSYDGGPAATGLGVTVDLAAGTVIDNWGDTDTVVNVEDVSGSVYADSITGNAADNYLYGAAGDDTIDGGDGNDGISGDAGNDNLQGGNGDDQLDGGSGNDVLDGGAGRDRVSYQNDIAEGTAGFGVHVDLDAGYANDNWGGIDRLVDIEDVTGSRYRDTLIGDAADNTLRGGDGDDVLVGGAGNDILDGGADGGAGDTVDYSAGPAGVSVNLAAGIATDSWGNTDTLVGIEHVTGTAFSDTLVGTSGRNWFRPGDGNDTVVGNGGDDVVMYEGITSAVNVDLRAGTASGAAIGSDTLIGIRNLHTGAGADTVQLGDFGAYVFARGGDDKLTGGNGNDNFIGGSGNDTIDGGAGRDTASYLDDTYDGNATVPATGVGVTVDLAAGFAIDNWGNRDTLVSIEIVQGSQYADSITGDDGNNDLHGDAGNDTLGGAGGNDWLDGADGDDILRGGAGMDQLLGGDGNDTIDGGDGVDSVNYGSDYGSAAPTGFGVVVNLSTGIATDNWGKTDHLSGIEDVQGSRYADIIIGNAAANNLHGDTGNDFLGGGDGNDWLDGGEGNDNLDGGTGNDAFGGGAGNDILVGGDGTDTVTYTNDYGSIAPTGLGVTVNLATGVATDNWGNADQLSGIENVDGSRYADVITGNAADNALWGQDGNDTLAGGDGNDWLDGGDGNDNLAGGTGNDGLSGGAGNDIINGGDGADRATYSNDYGSIAPTGLGVTVNLVTGTATDNWGNADTLVSIENVDGSRYADVITGNAGDNNLWGGEGADTLAGGDGNDWLDGGDGNDSLQGGTGNDGFSGGAGNDIINGGDGADRATYSNDYGSIAPSGLGVTVNLVTGTATDNWGNVDTLVSIENVDGSRYADVITGDASDNNLYGGDGSDKLAGGDGNDWLDGSNGNDILQGGAGIDQLSGGAGDDILDGGDGADTANYSNDYGLGSATPTGAGVTVDLAAGIAIDNWGNIDTLIGIERVQGSRYADSLGGDDANNNLYGGAGNDTLIGAGGNDWLDGGEGTDSLRGDAGDDQLSGGAGNDVINGGDGRDTASYGSDYGSIAPTGAGVKVNLGTGTATDNWGNTDFLVSIENVSGSRYGDTISGNAADNSLWGQDGNDTLSAGAGNDWLDGGTGDDSLQGGAGNDGLSGGEGKDTLDGGDGIDIAEYWNDYGMLAPTGAGVKVDLAAGTATDNWGYADKLAGIENVSGSRYGDTITGDAAGNALYGRDGNDLLSGGDGNDQLAGGAGNDVLDGGNGRDYADYRDSFSADTATGAAGVKVNLATGTATDNWGNTDTLVGIEDVLGTNFADNITGNAGENQLQGYGGNDILDGGLGADTMIGGDGSDTYYVRDTGDLVLETNANAAVGGTDTVYSYIGAYTLGANVENGRILSTGVANLTGNALDNILYAGTGDNVINGGDGIDTVSFYYGATGTVGITASLATGKASGSGTDTLVSIESLYGTNNADSFTGDAKANTLYTYAGNDTLDGGLGADTMVGGDGSDTYYVRDTGDSVVETNANAAVGGSDTVYSYIGAYTLGANVENGRIFSTGVANLTGNALDNILYAGAGDNVINGGDGIDTVSFTYGVTGTAGVIASLVTGKATGSGTDTLVNIEQLYGTNNADSFTGDAKANTLYTYAGNDTLDGGLGADTMVGGDGNDTYYVRDAGDSVVETDANAAVGGTDTVYSYLGAYTLGANVENGRIVSTGAANLTGNALDNFLYAGTGDNVIDGGDGIDTVSFYYGATGTVGITASLVTGKASGSGIDTLANIEQLYGTNNADSFTGDAKANYFYTYAGNDILDGGAGADTMVGGDGNDIYHVDNAGDVVSETSALAAGGIDQVVSSISYSLGANVEKLQLLDGTINGTGNELANTIVGGAGSNVINGGLGNDVLTGGAGADYFVFNTALDGTANVDRITDFSTVYDTIRLENAVFTKLAATGTLGANNFKVIGSAPLDADDFILYDKASGYLYYDADGSGAGAAVKFALVGVNLALTSADFTVI